MTEYWKDILQKEKEKLSNRTLTITGRIGEKQSEGSASDLKKENKEPTKKI